MKSLGPGRYLLAIKALRHGLFCWTIGVILAVTACSGNGYSPTNDLPPLAHHSHKSPIKHIILMIQENRTFNNLFATFAGANGTTTGKELIKKNGKYVEKSIKLTEVNLNDNRNLNHLYNAYLTAYNGGAMDAFNLIIQTFDKKPENAAPYEYVNPTQISPYLTIASQWGLADAMFQTQGSGSFTAHQDLIRGGTCISAVCSASSSMESLIDDPSTSSAWGCPSPTGATTSLISGDLQYQPNLGSFPCSKDFPDYGSAGYKTLRDLLDGKSVSWKYYTPAFQKNTDSALWNAFAVIAPVYYGSEWNTNVISPETTIFTDLTSGTLPTMSWVIPNGPNSDHPGSGSDTGPSWVASVVNAVGASAYWDSTVVIVVWDDWGGFYDPIAPPKQDDQGGPGFRVPMLVISPYVKIGSGSQGGYVSSKVYGFGSIIRFVEDTFNLGRLGTTDSTSTSIADMFNFKQSPRAFSAIPSSYKKAFFLRQRHSTLPVDTQ